MKESQLDVSPSLIANLQSAVSVQPRMVSLDDPTVAPQLLRAFNLALCYSRMNPPLPQCLSLLGRIIGFISVRLLGPLSEPASGALYRFNGIQGCFHHKRSVHLPPRTEVRGFQHQIFYDAAVQRSTSAAARSAVRLICLLCHY